MEILTKEQIKDGGGFASDELRSAVLDAMNDNDLIINFAYTDYGGSFTDFVISDLLDNKLEELEEDYGGLFVLAEHTIYNGGNIFVKGVDNQATRALYDDIYAGYFNDAIFEKEQEIIAASFDISNFDFEISDIDRARELYAEYSYCYYGGMVDTDFSAIEQELLIL